MRDFPYEEIFLALDFTLLVFELSSLKHTLTEGNTFVPRGLL